MNDNSRIVKFKINLKRISEMHTKNKVHEKLNLNETKLAVIVSTFLQERGKEKSSIKA